MADSTLLSCRDLEVDLVGRGIIHGLSCELTPGECVAVIGPNGAGKSTLLRALAGLIPYRKGEILAQGRSIRGLGRRALAQKVAFLPQGFRPEYPLRVEEFLRLADYPWDTPADEKMLDEALQWSGASQLIDRRMDVLSGGELQRVLLASIIIQRAAVLLLDEPGTFVDLRAQGELRRGIKLLTAERGCAVLVVTHDLTFCSTVADRVIALRGGRVAFQGPARQVLQRELLESLYDCVFEEIALSGQRTPLFIPGAARARTPDLTPLQNDRARNERRPEEPQ